MPKPKLFAYLRSILYRYGWGEVELGWLLDLSVVSVSRRLNAHDPFLQTEQYLVMDEFEIPYNQLHKVFPKNGVSRLEAQHGKD